MRANGMAGVLAEVLLDDVVPGGAAAGRVDLNKIGDGGEGSLFDVPGQPGTLLKWFDKPRDVGDDLRHIVAFPERLAASHRAFLDRHSAWAAADIHGAMTTLRAVKTTGRLIT